jgi:hypothetical protein
LAVSVSKKISATRPLVVYNPLLFLCFLDIAGG